MIRDGIQPFADLLRMYPGRFAAIASVVLSSFSKTAVDFFAPRPDEPATENP